MSVCGIATSTIKSILILFKTLNGEHILCCWNFLDRVGSNLHEFTFDSCAAEAASYKCEFLSWVFASGRGFL